MDRVQGHLLVAVKWTFKRARARGQAGSSAQSDSRINEPDVSTFVSTGYTRARDSLAATHDN
jgi:hypothetical protein